MDELLEISELSVDSSHNIPEDSKIEFEKTNQTITDK